LYISFYGYFSARNKFKKEKKVNEVILSQIAIMELRTAFSASYLFYFFCGFFAVSRFFSAERKDDCLRLISAVEGLLLDIEEKAKQLMHCN
jgi:hypothetical protein